MSNNVMEVFCQTTLWSGGKAAVARPHYTVALWLTLLHTTLHCTIVTHYRLWWLGPTTL